MNNPYPSPAELLERSDAQDRDDADAATCRAAIEIIKDAMSRLGRLDRIQHPNARWTPGDAVLALFDELKNAEGTALLVTTGALVVN